MVASVVPLWAARTLPLVDLPQHLYLLDVLARLHDPSTAYGHFFEPRPGVTAYVGYYELLRILGRLMPLELANRLFVTACVVALPLSLASMLRGFGRPAWPGLLAIPFAYGDNLGWGFTNYCAALPLALLAIGTCVRSLTDPPRRMWWASLLALDLLAVFVFHPLPLVALALGLPLLIALTPVTGDAEAPGALARLRPRLPALLSLLPVALVIAGWLRSALHAPAGAAGAKALANGFEFQSPRQNLHDFGLLLADLFQDGSDRWALYAVALVAIAAVALRRLDRVLREATDAGPARWRLPALVAIALLLYFTLPLHVPGLVYYVNPRFASLAACLMVGLVPRVSPGAQRALGWLAVVASLLLAWPMTRGFRAFDREARDLEALSKAMGERPVVMGLMYDNHSRIMSLPVYIHAAAVLARARGGIPDYTFASGFHMPVRYRATPPAPLLSGWRPDLFDPNAEGRDYEYFVVRGAPPERIFGDRIGHGLRVVAHQGGFWLVRRVPAE